MTSLHELRELPKEGEYFLSFEDLLEVIRDASVKHRFSFRILYKDPKRALYRCKNKECPWSVNAHLNQENENEIIVYYLSATTCLILTSDSGEVMVDKSFSPAAMVDRSLSLKLSNGKLAACFRQIWSLFSASNLLG